MAPRRLTRTLAAPAPRPCRRYLYAAAGVLALFAAVAIPAIPAAAQIGIQFVSAGGDGSGDLSITVESDYPLTDWTLQLSDGANTYSGFDDFSDFTDVTPGPFVDDADAPQTYVLNASAAAADLGAAGIEPGNYTVTAEAATDSNAPPDTLSGPQVLSGSFSYLAQPQVTLADGSSFSTTQPAQSVSLSGLVTCATLACPAGGWVGTTVTITDQTNPPATPPTGEVSDATGDFTVTGVTGIPNDSYIASVAAQTGVSLAAASAATTDDPEIFSDSISASATYGPQSITGTVDYQVTGSFTPMPAQGVVVTATAPGQAPVKSLPTTSSGSFTIKIPPITSITQWELSTPTSDMASTPFTAGTNELVTPLWPTTMTGFSAKVSKYMELTVGGCLATSVTPRPADDPTVDIEFKAGTSKTWKVLGAVPSKAMTGCSGVEFGGSGPAAAPRAYYRAYFPGDSAYEKATSSSVLATRTQVRYHDFAVTPHSVAAGKKITVSGTLQYLSGKTWRAYTKQEVLIAYAKRASNQTWYESRWVKTSSKGAFKVSFADTVGTQYWSADFNGNSTHYVEWAPTVLVKVHGRVEVARVATKPPVTVIRQGSASWQLLMAAQPLMVLLSP